MCEARDLSELAAIIKDLAISVSKQNDILERLVHASEAFAVDGAGKTITRAVETSIIPLEISKHETGLQTELNGASDKKSDRGTSSQSDTKEGNPEAENQLIRLAPIQARLVGVDRLTFYHEAEDDPWVSTRFLNDEQEVAKLNLERGFPKQGTATNQWRYWIKVFDHKHVAMYGGRPDFIPPWELRKHEGLLYHVDDISFSCPVPGDQEFRKGRHLQIPYSFAPPARKFGTSHRIAKTGLTVDWMTLTQNLGNLYAVPPDNRISFAFERNELRLKCASNQIDQYLLRTQALLEDLEKKGGKFFILDFDDRMAHAAYHLGAKTQISKHTLPYWTATGPALSAEEEYLSIRPIEESFDLIIEDKGDASINLANEDSGVRPWHRLISFYGIAAIVDWSMWNQNVGTRSNVFDDRLRLLIYKDPENRNFYQDSILEVFFWHIFCRRASRNAPRSQSDPFHITWTQIVDENDTRNIPSWRSGHLYGSENRFIQERAFTVQCFRDTDIQDGKSFATILLLAPPMKVGETDMNFVQPVPVIDISSGTSYSRTSPHTMILKLISFGLEEAANAWEEMIAYLEQLLDQHDPLFDPEGHDSLLFDDATFSRSRLYFWALDSLGMFKTNIEDTIEMWKVVWSRKEKEIRRDNELYQSIIRTWASKQILEEGSVDFWLPLVQTQIERLEGFKGEMEKLSQRTQALRDGLFNASSVIEGRESTRLGENVKLLTYVSIFYLPLGFCAALWSMDADYGITSFATTTIAVGAATFIVVANMKNILRTIGGLYRSTKQSVVNRMKQDPKEKWQEMGAAFSAFKPRRKAAKLSEWFVLYYMMIEVVRKLGAITQIRIVKHGSKGKDLIRDSELPVQGPRTSGEPVSSVGPFAHTESDTKTGIQTTTTTTPIPTSTPGFPGKMKKFLLHKKLSKGRRPRDVENTERQEET